MVGRIQKIYNKLECGRGGADSTTAEQTQKRFHNMLCQKSKTQKIRQVYFYNFWARSNYQDPATQQFSFLFYRNTRSPPCHFTAIPLATTIVDHFAGPFFPYSFLRIRISFRIVSTVSGSAANKPCDHNCNSLGSCTNPSENTKAPGPNVLL